MGEFVADNKVEAVLVVDAVVLPEKPCVRITSWGLLVPLCETKYTVDEEVGEAEPHTENDREAVPNIELELVVDTVAQVDPDPVWVCEPVGEPLRDGDEDVEGQWLTVEETDTVELRVADWVRELEADGHFELDKVAVFVALVDWVTLVDMEGVGVEDKVGDKVAVAVFELVGQGNAVLVPEEDTEYETVVRGETERVPVDEELGDLTALPVTELV